MVIVLAAVGVFPPPEQAAAQRSKAMHAAIVFLSAGLFTCVIFHPRRPR
jgi:hypothetical protein